jgi:hypothetical protein
MESMAKKKKKRFDVTKAVKAASRANIGTVPVTRRVPVKKKEPGEKYKPTIEKLLEE